MLRTPYGQSKDEDWKDDARALESEARVSYQLDALVLRLVASRRDFGLIALEYAQRGRRHRSGRCRTGFRKGRGGGRGFWPERRERL